MSVFASLSRLLTIHRSNLGASITHNPALPEPAVSTGDTVWSQQPAKRPNAAVHRRSIREHSIGQIAR